VCRAKELVETLKSWRFRRLILLGDIFDDLNFKRLRRSHWKVLSYLRKLAKRCEVIWIKGNHDAQFFDFIASLMGVEAHDEYAFRVGGRPLLCVHGDRFDRLLTENPLLSAVAGRLYQLIQMVDGRRKHMSRFIKRSSKGWLKVSQKVAASAIDYARKRGAEAIFCGHTHQAMTYEAGGLCYYNTGCWTDVPASYATIDSRGRIEIHEVA
jgi:UDP-2,3-diacylglucosamine pyrophosphatase LpxH